MKKCLRCNTNKESREFRTASRSKDGLGIWCKACNISAGTTAKKLRHREAGRLYWNKNKQHLNKIQKEWYRKLRDLVIQGYGGKCTCCTEDRREFLTLEHIGGGGNKHRQKMQQHQIFRQIIKSKFPNKYTILCWNCNASLAYSGYCPHKEGSINEYTRF